MLNDTPTASFAMCSKHAVRVLAWVRVLCFMWECMLGSISGLLLLSCLQEMQPLGSFLAQHSRQLGGQTLVRRDVCLDWGEHNAGDDDEGQGWYAGRLVAYDPDTGEFTVSSACCFGLLVQVTGDQV
jgi:hypothetical protein